MRFYAIPAAPPPRQPITEQTVPLTWAVLCLSCDEVRDGRLKACPKCASATEPLPLSRVLGREAA